MIVEYIAGETHTEDARSSGPPSPDYVPGLENNDRPGGWNPIDYPADRGDDGDDEMDIEEDEDDDMDIEADEGG
ncbi:hypothetical protein Tco_1063900 [Tanacetum coccineum]